MQGRFNEFISVKQFDKNILYSLRADGNSDNSIDTYLELEITTENFKEFFAYIERAFLVVSNESRMVRDDATNILVPLNEDLKNIQKKFTDNLKQTAKTSNKPENPTFLPTHTKSISPQQQLSSTSEISNKMKIQPAPFTGYEKAMDAWVNLSIPDHPYGEELSMIDQEAQKVMSLFEEDGSFESHFFLAELHRMGCHKTILSGTKKESIHLYFEPEHDQAIIHYKKARTAYLTRNGEIHVQIEGENDPAPEKTHQTMTLVDINRLGRQSCDGNPNAMHRLARFYLAELQCLKNHGARKIHVPDEKEEQWLEIRARALFTAAAKLFHPHAAQALIEDQTYFQSLEPENQLRFAMTAADPSVAEQLYSALPDSDRQIEFKFRNHKISVKNPMILKKLNDIHNDLRQPIMTKRTVFLGDCLIPQKHTAYAVAQPPAAIPMTSHEENQQLTHKR